MYELFHGFITSHFLPKIHTFHNILFYFYFFFYVFVNIFLLVYIVLKFFFYVSWLEHLRHYHVAFKWLSCESFQNVIAENTRKKDNHTDWHTFRPWISFPSYPSRMSWKLFTDLTGFYWTEKCLNCFSRVYFYGLFYYSWWLAALHSLSEADGFYRIYEVLQSFYRFWNYWIFKDWNDFIKKKYHYHWSYVFLKSNVFLCPRKVVT